MMWIITAGGRFLNVQHLLSVFVEGDNLLATLMPTAAGQPTVLIAPNEQPGGTTALARFKAAIGRKEVLLDLGRPGPGQE